MQLTNLKINHLRNLTQVNIAPSRCNIIYGKNGSGKTSLLESIFLLSRGKSFRTHQPKRYIQHQQPHSTVFANFENTNTLAIQKHGDASTLLKLNGNTIKTQSEITRTMPTLLIDPSSMDMLEQGSASRRQLLDWLAFHVKPEFYPQWLAYQKLLKQRNSLLKQIHQLTPIYQQQLAAWDVSLAKHAKQIHHYRQMVFDAWLPHFLRSTEQLLPKYAQQLQVSYQAGFDTSTALHETLQQRLQQDVQQGYTRVGCHRADIHVHWKKQEHNDVTGSAAKTLVKEQAVNVFSRGEKKLLITALRLSQLPLLHNSQTHLSNSPIVSHETLTTDEMTSIPIVLLDDITAELDNNAIKVLLKTLSGLSCQVFVTSLTKDVLSLVEEHWQTYKVFHVEHGEVIEVIEQP